MDRIYESGQVSQTPPEPPENPLLGYPVTSETPGVSSRPGAFLFYAITEELRNVSIARGITPDPQSVDQVLQAILAGVAAKPTENNSWVAQRSVAVMGVFSGAKVATLDFELSNMFNLGRLTGNFTLGNPVNAKPGQTGVIFVAQDATGGRLLAFGSNFDFVGDIVPALSTESYAVDVLAYTVLPSGRIRINSQYATSNASTVLPVAGELLGQYCLGTTLMGSYANGTGSTYEQTISENSVSCGYIVK